MTLDIHTIKDIADIAGVVLAIIGGAYRLGRQDRELRWQSKTLLGVVLKSGSVPPPRGPLPTLTDSNEAKPEKHP